MRSFFRLILLSLIISCNQNNSGKTSSELEPKNNDSLSNEIHSNKDSGSKSGIVKIQNSSDPVAHKVLEKKLIGLSTEILECIIANDYNCLADFVHPALGVRFSTYAFIDAKKDQSFSRKKLIAARNDQKLISWGYEDGTGKPIRLSIHDYFKEFVYDADFLNAEKKVLNKFLGGGNSLNNLKEVYPGCNFTEFHFSGFDPKYGGMDWKSLRLVFKEYENRTYLIAIVHDEWTI